MAIGDDAKSLDELSAKIAELVLSRLAAANPDVFKPASETSPCGSHFSCNDYGCKSLFHCEASFACGGKFTE